MASQMLFAIVRKPLKRISSRNFVGFPPSAAPDQGVQPMAVPRVLIIETRPDGVFLDRFDESGEEAGDTWHESIGDAKAQAVAEFGDQLGAWRSVPEEAPSAVHYALAAAEPE